MTVSGGDIIYAADLNDAVGLLRGLGIRLIQQSGQSLTSGSPTAITYGSGSEDFHFNNGTSWHSTSSNTSRVTPDVAGYYICEAHTHMAVGATSYTQINAAIGVNGTRVDPQQVLRPASGTPATSASVSAVVHVNGTSDYIEHFGAQTSGGSNSTSSTSTFRCTFTVRLWRPDSI